MSKNAQRYNRRQSTKGGTPSPRKRGKARMSPTERVRAASGQRGRRKS